MTALSGEVLRLMPKVMDAMRVGGGGTRVSMAERRNARRHRRGGGKEPRESREPRGRRKSVMLGPGAHEVCDSVLEIYDSGPGSLGKTFYNSRQN